MSFGYNKKKEEPERGNIDLLIGEYGQEAVKKMKESRAKIGYIILQPSQMDDDSFIDAFEKSPTYNREKRVADEIKELGRQNSGTQKETPINNNRNGNNRNGNNVISFS